MRRSVRWPTTGRLRARGLGELRARGIASVPGYLDCSLDAAAFDDDGYFRTGDIGYVDADGYVTVSDGLKDVIIRKGEKISAKEVKDVLYGARTVADVAVIGLPDAVRGERCCAVVLPVDRVTRRSRCRRARDLP